MLPAAISEDQQERQTDLWSAYAAEGISSTSLTDRDQEIRELRQQVQDLTGILETFSLTQRQISERETRADWHSQHWKSWQDGWWHDQRWTQAPAVGSWWDDVKLSWDSWQDLDRWAAPSGYSSRKWDISEPPTFPGFSANYLMWRKAVLRWKMTTDHPVEKLGTKVMNSLDWTVQAFVDARITTEALLPDAVESILRVLDAKAGWIQEDESKLLLRKALFSVERGKDESLRQYTTRRLAQIEAASAAALVTMPTTTWGTVLKEDARLTKQHGAR